MSDDELPMVYWPEIIAPLLVGLPQPLKGLAESRTMFNAVFAETHNEWEIRDRIGKIIWLVAWIQIEQRHGIPGVKELAASIEQFRKEWQAKIKTIESLAREIQAPYQQQLFAIASSMNANMVGPPMHGKRGAAAASNKSAWTGWCAREIDALVSIQAVNRNATIAELLEFVGIKASRQLIRALLEASKTRKPK
jgi:hypothetical protein